MHLYGISSNGCSRANNWTDTGVWGHASRIKLEMDDLLLNIMREEYVDLTGMRDFGSEFSITNPHFSGQPYSLRRTLKPEGDEDYCLLLLKMRGRNLLTVRGEVEILLGDGGQPRQWLFIKMGRGATVSIFGKDHTWTGEKIKTS